MTNSIPTYRMLWREHGSAECGVQVMRLDPHVDTPAHDHLFLEIALVEQGEAQHQTASGTAVVSAGQVVIIRPGVWHGYLHCRNMVVTNCLISSSLLHMLLPLLQQIPAADALFRRRGSQRLSEESPVVLTPPRWAFARLREAMGTMMREQHAQDSAWQAANVGQLLQILALVVRCAEVVDRRPALPEATARAVQAAAALVERQYTTEVHLDDLARAVAISPAHLSRSFKRHMGMGLVDYCHHLRVEEACRLLRLTDLSVSAIATRVGYNEIAYFSRCFRRRMSRSPIEYRRSSAAV